MKTEKKIYKYLYIKILKMCKVNGCQFFIRIIIISVKVCTKEWKRDVMLAKDQRKKNCDMHGKYEIVNEKKDFNLGNWQENFLLIKNWWWKYQEIILFNKLNEMHFTVSKKSYYRSEFICEEKHLLS